MILEDEDKKTIKPWGFVNSQCVDCLFDFISIPRFFQGRKINTFSRGEKHLPIYKETYGSWGAK